MGLARDDATIVAAGFGRIRCIISCRCGSKGDKVGGGEAWRIFQHIDADSLPAGAVRYRPGVQQTGCWEKIWERKGRG